MSDWMYICLYFQLNQQQNNQTAKMIISHRKPTKHINLFRLKKDIDVKLQAILRYLEHQGQNSGESQNEYQQQYRVQTNEDFNLSGIKIREDQANMEKNGHENQSTTLNNRLSMDEQIDVHCTQQPDTNRRNSQNVVTQHQIISARMSLNQSILERRQQFQEQQKNTEELKSLTPIKFSPQIIQNENNSQKSDESESRKNIQQIADQKIFGVPLASSINVEKPVENANLQLAFSAKSEVIQFIRSGTHTARSKKQKNKQNMQYSSPCISLSKQQSKQQRKTPFKTPHSTQSATRKLYEYFAGNTRATKPITGAMIQKMKLQLEQESKKVRKQAQDNNVRAKLLKRIQGCKSKSNQFLAIK